MGDDARSAKGKAVKQGARAEESVRPHLKPCCIMLQIHIRHIPDICRSHHESRLDLLAVLRLHVVHSQQVEDISLRSDLSGGEGELPCCPRISLRRRHFGKRILVEAKS